MWLLVLKSLYKYSVLKICNYVIIDILKTIEYAPGVGLVCDKHAVHIVCALLNLEMAGSLETDTYESRL